MDGKAYAEAVKAGFTHEQIKFLGVALSETRRESFQEVREKLKEERMRPIVIIAETWKQWALIGIVFLCGFGIGAAG